MRLWGNYFGGTSFDQMTMLRHIESDTEAKRAALKEVRELQRELQQKDDTISKTSVMIQSWLLSVGTPPT